MIRFAELLTCFFICFSLLNPISAQTVEKDSTAGAAAQKDSLTHSEIEETPIVGVMTDQQLRSYRSDFFPMDLTQRGRLAASAYRGMPVGFFQYEFAAKQLTDPVAGFWNEQWIPYYQINWEQHRFGSLHESYKPPVPFSSKPVTRVVFSQDYTVGLSFIDINFIQRLSPTNYIQLSGSNLLGGGSEGLDYSKFNVNTYRAQLHWQLGKRWDVDFFYWHMRNKFNMSPVEGSESDKFKLVGDNLWAAFHGKLGERDSLVIIPGYTTSEDQYTKGDDKLKENRSKMPYTDIHYFHRISGGFIGAQFSGRFIHNNGKRFWAERNESDGKARAFWDWKKGPYNFRLEGGVYYHSETGWEGLGSAAAERNLGSRGKIGIAAFSTPESIPLLWRTVYYDSIPRYEEEHFIQKQGVSVFFKTYLTNLFWLQVEPFAFRANNYPVLFEEEHRWQKQTIENYGLRFFAGWNIWRFQLLNDFSYNHNYQEAFAQQISNISTVKLSFPLFNNALKLDGVLNWRYVGYFQLIEFNRLLYHYRLSDAETGPFYIGDARVQAHFRDATVFFVWENFLSEDFRFVNYTLESLIIFRLGIDWVLFD